MAFLAASVDGIVQRMRGMHPPLAIWRPSYGGAKANAHAATSGADRLDHLDGLRAFAVLLVVVSHGGLESIVPGGLGVTIFFTISGFIITLLLLREREQTGCFAIKNFYLRRALKILPPMIAVILIPTAIYAVFQPVAADRVASQAFFYYNWQFTPGNHPASNILPGSSVLWSLSIEEQFYIVFALAWILLVRLDGYWRILTTLALAAVLLSVGEKLAMAFDSGNADRIYYGSDTRADSIALGIIAALVYFRWSRDDAWMPRLRNLLASRWTLAIATTLLLGSVAYRDEYFRNSLRYSVQSFAACLIILFGALEVRESGQRSTLTIARLGLVQTIGLASYCIYLVHFSLFTAFEPVTTGSNRVIGDLVLTLIAVTVGWCCYRVVESPLEPARRALRPQARAAARRETH